MKLGSYLRTLPSILAGRPAPADSKALDGLARGLVNADVLTLEILRIDGQKAPGRSLERAARTLGKYIAGEVRTVEAEPPSVGRDLTGAVSLGELNSAMAERPVSGPAHIPVVLAPALGGAKWRGYSALGSHGEPWVVVSAAGIERKPLPMLSRPTCWQLVITHELFHALGLPCGASHIRGQHCTHPECVLYQRVDARSVLATIHRSGPPLDLCGACRRDLRRTRIPGRSDPIGPADLADPKKRADVLVALNADNPVAYAARAEACRSRGEHEQALRDLKRAIELDGSDARTYAERGLVFAAMKRYGEAADDFGMCLERGPDEKLASNALNNLAAAAWRLATSDDEALRDGPRAVEAATCACERTGWAKPWPVATLAAACAECGQFDRAVEYQGKAVELADNEDDAEKFRRTLALYRDGRPSRGT